MSETRWRPVAHACLAVVLLVSGCAAIYRDGGPPTVVYAAPFGTMLGNPSQTPPVPAASVNPDGMYGGTAYPLDTGGGLCINNITVNGFRVHANSVRWGRFRGRIEDSGVQMVSGNTWVYGQFVGDGFDGQISSQGPLGEPGCSYLMRLRKTASKPP